MIWGRRRWHQPPLAQVPALLAAGAFRDAKTVAGLLLALRRLE